ncbi:MULTISPECIES: GIY-YIG nuclease family protein [Bacteroides]|uniref:GIY-YIG nuclease family protein n=1 Tax=Bacteroides TaxID=816 RepID=UPI000E4329FB|nr:MULTISPECIES: GIY-YIG nuclease family protein [Bacteroides]MBS7573349.1 GIY-YIG nuclease family protein [Bacteroides propionicigenes]RGM30934.1 GIY-YIG nuclease family protein [Bacteroides sp. OM08-17BH]RHJ54124.1 GIY-YIG nuclease family protein [Bacteroides sp. AM10-21B]HBO08016.1 excinuclease ABC subunit C [Bacteroides sp.]
MEKYCIYIMSNSNRTVLYIGVTNNLYRRYNEHKSGKIEGFTKKYSCHILLYYEEFQNIEYAIAREKSLKGWSRSKKDNLIREKNPRLEDLGSYLQWNG